MGQKTLAGQASKVVSFLQQVSKKLKCINIKIYLQLFDRMVLPILLYGSDIWGFETYDCIENIQIKFCKYILKLPSSTPNVAVLGECGRYPIKVYSALHFLKYWCKLIQMESSRLPKGCYKMIFKLDQMGRKTWATKVKELLFHTGFGFVWISQDVGDISEFIRVAKINGHCIPRVAFANE